MANIDKIAFLLTYGVETIRSSLVKEGLIVEAVISLLVLIILIVIL